MRYEIEGITKLRSGRYLIPVSIENEGNRLAIKFGFNRELMEEIKSMEDAKWHGYEKPPRKVWSVKNSERNRFQLNFLAGKNVYQKYDAPLIDFQSRRPIYTHQKILTAHFLTRRQCIGAAEMGVGKTLSAIEAMEYSEIPYEEMLWVGPKSALTSVTLEFYKWKSRVFPKMLTYEGLKSEIENWPSGKRAPRLVVMDECSRVKNPTAQRSKAAKYLADSMRDAYGDDAYILLMSGSPAPKSPADWWHLCEIVCPGFLREGNIEKFKNRLAFIVMAEGAFDGGAYPKLVTWWDDESKCAVCGMKEEEGFHNPAECDVDMVHAFKKSVNQVGLLYKRMSGLVLVQFKKDCLDLPEKIYRRIICKPKEDTLRAMQLILAGAPTTIAGLTLCRELSDGFQYVQTQTGEQVCPNCNGKRVQDEYFDQDDPESSLTGEEIAEGHRFEYNDEGVRIGIKRHNYKKDVREVPCYTCNQKGTVPTYSRETREVPCPKDDAVRDLLDQYEDEGRTVFWAGFTGSIERLTKLVAKEEWIPLRLDGRGWWSTIPGSDLTLMQAFQDKSRRIPKMAFIGQPGAGGMGLTLTESSMECYFSNTFKFEDRNQSEDRIHRIGADKNRGVTIYDLIHLPTDLTVLDNLQKKRELQGMTLGLMKSEIEAATKAINEERTT